MDSANDRVTVGPRTVLVTGAGGGLGGATVRLFADRGWTVFGADLRPPGAGAGVVPLDVDVTSNDSVERALARVSEACPEGLGAVVNFAGIMRVGALVEVSDAELRRVLEVNLLGTHRVNAAAFPLLRQGSGRVVNISSETGWQRALMMNGPYAISKHALEAYSDALRRELMFLGIPVVVVQPGPFRTDMVGGIGAAFAAATHEGSPFERLARRTGRLAVREEGRAGDPAVLAETVWEAVTAGRPRARYRVGTDPRRRIMHHLPVPVADRLLRRALG